MNDISKFQIDSDIIQMENNKIFLVSGNNHPKESIIIKDLEINNSLEIICGLNEDYDFFHPNSYQKFKAVSKKDIKAIFYPEILYNEIGKDISPQLFANNYHNFQKTIKFSTILLKLSGISPKNIGISISDLLNDNNKIIPKIVVYGFYDSLKIRETLRRIYERKIILERDSFEPLKMADLKLLYKSNFSNACSKSIEFIKIWHRRLSIVKFNDEIIVLQFMEFSDRTEYSKKNMFYSITIQNIGTITFTGQIRGDKNWWTTPSVVNPININIINMIYDNPANLELLEKNNLKTSDFSQICLNNSYFIENIRLLELFKAKGTLELVTSIENKWKPYLQVSLNDFMEDFIKIL